MKTIAMSLVCLGCAASVFAQPVAGVWPVEKAQAWYAAQPWLVGANFAPSNAINQLEMWQADTFDLQTIDRELGWASQIGMNTMRVFLHDMIWQQDSQAYLNRIDQFLAVCQKHNIRPMIVLFDSVWDPYPQLGKQRDPKPHVHNSGWVQGPHLDVLKSPEKVLALEPYVKGVLERFKNDPRVLMWDLYNEPGNRNNEYYRKFEPADKAELGLNLLKQVFQWARQVNPSQPLTAGVWQNEWQKDKADALNKFQLENSDIITFHDYSPMARTRERVEALKTYGRPLICTEYMARTAGSTFTEQLPYFKEQNIGAINWGLVAGKTQTNYPWESWDRTFTAEPEVWFHEVFRLDGTPYNPAETALIQKLTGAAGKAAPPQPASGNPVVSIKTSKGEIRVELFPDKAPVTVKNFLDYVNSGFYSGTIFHRVIPGFMIQGGGMLPDMQEKPTQAPIKNEASAALKNDRGTIAMARRNPPHTATSQFFINVADNAPLNYVGPGREGYAVFGRVIDGMNVADAIVSVPTKNVGPHSNVPSQPILIESITVVKP
jgi:cyclophilin family peptidyl-prolyl cis-trans isomerase